MFHELGTSSCSIQYPTYLFFIYYAWITCDTNWENDHRSWTCGFCHFVRFKVVKEMMGLCMVSMLLLCAEENSWFIASLKKKEVTWLFYYSLHRPLFKSSKSSARSVSYLFVDDIAIAKIGVKIFEHHYFCCLTAWLFAKGLLIVGLYHNLFCLVTLHTIW